MSWAAPWDLIGNGFFDFYPGNGLYVDLDGSTNDAGVLTSSALSLAAGTYVLRFDLGGSPRGDTNIVNVALGTAYAESFYASNAPLATVTRVINVLAPATASRSFGYQRGDNLGLILDNVSVTAVPEPGTWTMLVAGLGVLGLLAPGGGLPGTSSSPISAGRARGPRQIAAAVLARSRSGCVRPS